MNSALFAPLTLPNGSTLPNRIGKSAMAENMAAQGQLPDERFARLYQRFADGGAGLIITGNVMVDANGVSTAGDVVLTQNSPIAPFQAWAKAAKSKGAQVWMQINHPGRQAMAGLGKNTFAPSAIGLELGKHSKLFVTPRAMTEQDILDTITRFAETAQAAERAGFDGVQIHAAHGYLISQFLSPLSNQRTDRWGGSIENRARFLLETIAAVRAAVSPAFSVAVKINSADFQRGGFDESDALAVVEMLNGTAVDLVELSGGSYESPALFSGEAKDNRTLAREAYFLEFAAQIAKVAQMPLMTTGGIRRLAVAEAVLEEGIAVAGIATALALNPNLPNEWKNGNAIDGNAINLSFKDKTLRGLAQLILAQRHLHRLGKGKPAGAALNPIWTLVSGQIRDKYLAMRYKKWVDSQ